MRLLAALMTVALIGACSGEAAREGSYAWCAERSLSRSACDNLNYIADSFGERPEKVYEAARDATRIAQGYDSRAQYSPELLAVGEICDAAYPFDDGMFRLCVLDLMGERTGSSGSPQPSSRPTTTSTTRPTTTTEPPTTTTTTLVAPTTTHTHPRPPVALAGRPFEPYGSPLAHMFRISVVGHADCSGPRELVIDLRFANEDTFPVTIYNVGISFEATGHFEAPLLHLGWTWDDPGVLEPGTSVLHHEHLDAFSETWNEFLLGPGDWVDVTVDAEALGEGFVFGATLTCS